MSESPYQTLLAECKAVYDTHHVLAEFAPFPDDIEPQPVTADIKPPCLLLQQDTKLASKTFSKLQHAMITAAPFMRWRAIYHDSKISTDFMAQLGCYAIIGNDAPFSSAKIRLFLIYMPAGLYYPWHSHPAEELYLVLSGKAQFKRDGCQDTELSEGMSLYHKTNQPHAIETTDEPMLSLVVWRNHLDIPPILLNRP